MNNTDYQKAQILEALDASGYTPKTSRENIAANVITSYDNGSDESNMSILEYVDASGGWAEFDSDF